MELKTAAERSAYLDQACGTDAALRLRVERPLAAHPQAGDFLARLAFDRDDFDMTDTAGGPDSSLTDPTEGTILLEGSTPPTIPGSRSIASGGLPGSPQPTEPALPDTTSTASPLDLDGRRVIPSPVGRVIAGRYPMLEVLGEGSKGTVYRAEQ